MGHNGWRKEYEDEHVRINVGPKGRVGVWYHQTPGHRLIDVGPDTKPIVGRGRTMQDARDDVKRQRTP